VKPPERHDDLVAPERAVPAERVVVVRVDERPVDVEDDGLGHARTLYRRMRVEERHRRDRNRCPLAP
jgi:hypothetical protein